MKFLCIALLAACTLPDAKPATGPEMTPALAAQSTFRVNVSDGSMGTGWIVKNDTVSTLMTAGHVCDSEDEVSFEIEDRYGNKWPVASVVRHPKYDLCILRAAHVIGFNGFLVLGPEMPLSSRQPAYDEPVAFVGAPLGVWGCDRGGSIPACGMAPVSRGVYAGGLLVAIPATGGASGSALFTADGVFGVLVEGYRGYDSLTFYEPFTHMIEFLDSI